MTDRFQNIPIEERLRAHKFQKAMRKEMEFQLRAAGFNPLQMALERLRNVPHPLATALPGDNIRAHDAIAKNNG